MSGTPRRRRRTFNETLVTPTDTLTTRVVLRVKNFAFSDTERDPLEVSLADRHPAGVGDGGAR